MRTNAALTIYAKSVHPTTHSEVWTRSTITRIAWEDRRGAMRSSVGDMQADEVVVFVPFARGTLSVKAGDVIVRGLVTDVISASFTITDLRAKYVGNIATVRDVGKMDLGSLNMRHWQIGAS